MFGSHLSIAGGLHNALLEAQHLGMDCVQVFTKNQRQWKTAPLTKLQIDDWFTARRVTGITDVISHDSYLINLASPDRAVREKSIGLFREELRRCETLAIPFLVTHPGAHVGAGESQGMKRVARSLDRVHKSLPGYKTVTLLEITAGQGTTLGYTIEQLKTIIDLAADPDRLAICLDTAHLLGAGYNLSSATGTRAVIKQIDKVVGLDRVRCIHVNDSKVERGSRKDRHEHIGHGHVALDAFEVIVKHAAFKRVPKILETAKEKTLDGREWDAVNLEVLRALVRR